MLKPSTGGTQVDLAAPSLLCGIECAAQLGVSNIYL